MRSKAKLLGLLACGGVVVLLASTAALTSGCSDAASDLDTPERDVDDSGSPAKAIAPSSFGAEAGTSSSASCQLGQTRPCTPPMPADAGADAGLCSPGVETCVQSGEFPKWGACTGGLYAAPRGTYSKRTSGAASGSTKLICCESGDTVVSVVDCGDGDNHSAEQQGNCGVGHEGHGNGGSACVEITCKGSGLGCPADGGTPP